MPSDKQADPRIALNLIVDAYEASLAKGLSPEAVANAALSSALGMLVQVHGEELVATMIEDLPGKVRNGQFTQQPK